MPFPFATTAVLQNIAPVISWTIPDGTTNYNETAWRADAAAAGWDGISAVELEATLGAGSVMGATSTSLAAFDTGATPLPLNTTLKLIVAGRVLGKGGTGGRGGLSYPFTSPYPVSWSGQPGGFGGPAIIVRIPLIIDNESGIIGGGGGAGGGGQASMRGIGEDQRGGGGGGAGQGFTGSAGGPGGNSNPAQAQPAPGGDSNENGPGAGGSSRTAEGGNGGAGGALGAPGQNGFLASIFGQGSSGSGGATGAAVQGIENVTWVEQGDTRGPLVSL